MNSEDEDLLRIAPAVELGCRQLSCWELLKLNVLLKNMDFENALKVCGKRFEWDILMPFGITLSP